MKLVLPAESTLLGAIRLLIPGASNRTLRQMLERRRISLNGKIHKVAAHRVFPGDRLEVLVRGESRAGLHGLKIVFEDNDLLLVEKPSGLLTVATMHERDRTAYAFLREHLKERDPRLKLFVVHRLDKFASGVLVFAKSEPVQSRLQELFSRHEIERRYWAIVEGRVARDQGTIRSRLAENPAQRMHSTKDAAKGKEAVTHYRVLRRFPQLTALEIRLETGRKNQIRVHLSEMGHPIAGDRAYGGTSDPMGRLGLHAFLLAFRHPGSAAPVRHQTGIPPEFARYLPK